MKELATFAKNRGIVEVADLYGDRLANTMAFIETPTEHFTETNVPSQVPGVDVVLPVDEHVDDVLNNTALKVMGALHRRFWNRRQDMLQEQAIINLDSIRPIADADAADAWADRLDELGRLSDAIDAREDEDDTVSVLVARGWDDAEPGVLVDGRAVPGCVFDVAVAAASAVTPLRNGEPAIAVSLPTPSDETEAKLYADLVSLTEDRLGIDRGTVRYDFGV